MTQIAMKECVIRGVDFVNNISGVESMEIGAQVDSRVDYSEREPECKCTFSLTVRNTGDRELIKIVVRMEAIYAFIGEDNRDIHIKINEELFSRAKGTACAMCGVVGLPPMAIPPISFADSQMVEVSQDRPTIH